MNVLNEILQKLDNIEQILTVTKNTPIPEIEIINRPVLRKRLNISEPTAIAWGKRGKLTELRIGGQVRYNWYQVVKDLEKAGRRK